MTPNEKSAIIGYWRSGASIEHIMVITGRSYMLIINLIDQYKETLED
jgi:transposase